MASALQLVTELGPLLGLSSIIGGCVVAVANHLFTRRQEQDVWLRDEQIKANRKYYSAAAALRSYAQTGEVPAVEAATPSSIQEIVNKPTPIHVLAEELATQYFELIPVCSSEVVTMAALVMQTLPGLVFQAVPLPPTHMAALQQRAQALQDIGDLLTDLAMTMRIDAGVADREDRRNAPVLGASHSYRVHSLSLADRLPPPLDLGEVLWHWQVQTMDGAIPENLSSYRVNASRLNVAGVQAQGSAFKPPDGYWRFGIADGLAQTTEVAILQDAVRLITGNVFAFERRFVQPFRYHNGGRLYLWVNVGP